MSEKEGRTLPELTDAFNAAVDEIDRRADEIDKIKAAPSEHDRNSRGRGIDAQAGEHGAELERGGGGKHCEVDYASHDPRPDQ